MKTVTLESLSLWYKYKTEVWLEEYVQSTVIHNTIRAIRAFRNFDNLAYVSVPITSGKFLYLLMTEEPLLNKDAQIDMTMRHNWRAGLDFVKELTEQIDFPIVYPMDLVPARQKWSQVHFQALWLNIIAEKCTELHMMRDWEYSNGCSEEFVHTWQLKLGLPKHPKLLFYNTKEGEKLARERMRNIIVYNHLGEEMSINDGVKLLNESVDRLKGSGFKADTLSNSLDLLKKTEELIKRGFYQ